MKKFALKKVLSVQVQVTRALGFKGGIGTSSRILPNADGGYTIGVFVQSNFGGILSTNGVPVGRELEKFPYADRFPYHDDDEGSCMIIIATDAPLSAQNLKRLAKRSFLAFGKVGAYSSNGSGDYSIAFSTHSEIRVTNESSGVERKTLDVLNSRISPLFLAVVEATEKALINSLFMAHDISGNGRTQEALPIDKTMEILKKYNALNWNETIPPWTDKQEYFFLKRIRREYYDT